MESPNNNYDAVILSHGLPSLLSSLNCINKNMNILIVDRTAEYKIKNREITLYPYELPIFGLTNSEYAEDFKVNIGIKDFKNFFFDIENPLSVVFADNRFDYSKPYIKEEIRREFPDCAEDFIGFIDEIMEIEEKIIFLKTHGWKDKFKFMLKNPVMAYNLMGSDVSFLYDKHGLPLKIRSILDAILFVFSGVHKKKFPSLEAISILSSVLYGISVPKDGTYSFRSYLLKTLSKSVDSEHIKGALDIKKRSGKFNTTIGVDKRQIHSKLVITDHDHIKHVFVKKMFELKNNYSENILYPYSIYIKIPSDAVPKSMNRWLIYIDADKSQLLNYDNVYAVRTFLEDDNAVIRLTSFMGYGSFDIDNSIHRNKALKMYQILKRIIPSIDTFDPEIYPDFNSDEFGLELYKSLSNVEQGDVVYTGIPAKIKGMKIARGFISCGREEKPYLGFEGVMNNILKELN